ncbi:MAG: hypothetical protein Kow0059_12590 [Candidatus Sumerlaeia bacterium]
MNNCLELFIPGRVCLFGEHSDWAGEYRRQNSKIEKGFTILTGTNQGLFARVKPHPDSLVIRSTMPDGRVIGPHAIPMRLDDLLEEAENGGFFSYCAGVAYQILTYYHVKGLEIDNYKTTLPIRKGLSSSAAVCVLVARAFNKLYDLKMTTRGEMEAAYQGELRTPSRCGRMDQGCAFGSRPVMITYDRELIQVKELRVKKDIHLVIADLKGEKDTTEILRSLNRCYPFAETDVEKGVQHYLGPVNREIVSDAAEALMQGDAEALGRLMTKAQRLFDKYMIPACPGQLTAPLLHRALNYEPIQRLIWGGKGVGSQGDGCAQFVVRSPEAQREVSRILEQDLGCECFHLDIQAARGVRKAVIPAAGYGTRLFPASKVVKKELFPVIDEAGVAKPIILAIVEEALSAGIEEVCIIVQRGDERLFEELFNEPVGIEHFNKLPRRYQVYHQDLLNLGKRVSIISQDRQEGFGHAVWCARQWVGDEPFFLMLGDHLYKSWTGVPCARQLMDMYEKYQANIVAVQHTPEADISQFGTVAGVWRDRDDGVLAITEFAEKPTVDYARESLRVEGLPEGQYLCIFGQYILKPDVFELLEQNIENNIREKGEFQLTTALEQLRQKDEFLAYITQGRRFDTGNPEAYIETVMEFGRSTIPEPQSPQESPA